MSESGDYTSTNWVSTHDFASARATYTNSVVNRSYTAASSAKVKPEELVCNGVVIDNPTLIIISDVTGSMGRWPAVMFSKLPYLMHELKVYLGDGASLLVAAVGDATSDDYPLQVQTPKNCFDDAKEAFTKLVVEGNGGGQQTESYELAAAYFMHGVQVSRGCRKPILVFIGDEKPYDMVSKAELAVFGVNAENESTEKLFKKLCEVYEVYLIHKPYNDDWNGGITKAVKKVWTELLPSQHVIPLSEPERVVDVLFGILAGETDKVDYFKGEIVDRQKPEQVTTVLTALKDLYATNKPKTLTSGKSTFHKLPAGKPSKPLL